MTPSNSASQEIGPSENQRTRILGIDYGRARIGLAIANALTVPDASVLHGTENEPFVYVQSPAKQNEFARRLVQTGDSHGGRTLIAGGLKEGERVVGDGSLFLQFKNSLQH